MQATIIYTGQYGISFDFTVGCVEAFSKEEKLAFAERAFNALNSGKQDDLGVRSMSVGDLILFNDASYLVCLPNGWGSMCREQAIDFQKICPIHHIKRLDMLKEFEKIAEVA